MIVDAASQIADQEGLNGVTLAVLSKKMNVRSPSLYNHINGLQAIRTELAVSGLTKLYDQKADAVTVQKGDSALFSLAQAYVDFAVENPGYYEAALLKVQDKGRKSWQAKLSGLSLTCSLKTAMQAKRLPFM